MACEVCPRVESKRQIGSSSFARSSVLPLTDAIEPIEELRLLVNPMPPPALFPTDQSLFNRFLFAPFREDRNGLVVSVLSTFARLDRDPWRRQQSFDRLPAPAAKERLRVLISALPHMQTPDKDASAIAERLVALLPHAMALHGSVIPSPRREVTEGGFVLRLALMNIIVIAFLFSVRYLFCEQSPRRICRASFISPEIIPASRSRSLATAPHTTDATANAPANSHRDPA